MQHIINENNFMLYAAKCYENPSCDSMEEFYEDINRFKYLRRLITKYETNGDMKVRLALNHIIVMYNVFGLECTRMLFLKFKDVLPILKPFLVALNYLPEKITNVENETVINTSDITMDQNIVHLLRMDLTEYV